MHMTKKTTTAFIFAALLPGCGDTPTNMGASAEEGGETTNASNGESTTAPATTAGSSDGGSEGNSNSNTNATSPGDTSSGDDGNDDSPIKLDQGVIPDVPGQGECEGGNGGKGGGGNGSDPDFSFIWIANSTQGTVSKIDTVTMEEVGRYWTRSDMGPNGSPSRTSVNLNGDVAVANRTGGVTKFIANTAICDSGNTSTGAADIKNWPDDCMAWSTPLAYASNRPVAWTSGEWSGITCRYENTKLWTSGANATIDVLFLDGETGVVEQTIPIPEAQAQFYGIYGAASDADSNFWGSQLGIGHLVYVDVDTFDHEVYPMPIGGYGMTVDQDGYAYTCSSGVAKFDPSSLTWQSNPNVGGGGGCMTDGLGNLYVGGYAGGGAMVQVDTDTLTVNTTINIPNYVHGISVDFYGYVWGVTLQTPEAYKVDPIAGTFEVFTGLTGPYTYSDMTGYALSNASGLPPSG